MAFAALSQVDASTGQNANSIPAASTNPRNLAPTVAGTLLPG